MIGTLTFPNQATTSAKIDITLMHSPLGASDPLLSRAKYETCGCFRMHRYSQGTTMSDSQHCAWVRKGHTGHVRASVLSKQSTIARLFSYFSSHTRTRHRGIARFDFSMRDSKLISMTIRQWDHSNHFRSRVAKSYTLCDDDHRYRTYSIPVGSLFDQIRCLLRDRIHRCTDMRGW